MTHRAGLLGSAALYFAASAFAGAVPFFLLPVMTRFLSPGDFGVIAMFSTLLVLLGTIVGLGMKGAITARFFQAGEKDLAPFVTTCLVSALVTALVIAAISWPLRQSLTHVTQIPDHWFLIAVLATVAQFATTVQLALLQARTQVMRFSILQVLQSAINVSVSLLLVVGFGFAWEGRIIGLVGALVFGGGVAMTMLWSNFDIAWPPRKVHAREALTYGLPLVAQGLGGTMILVGDRVLITTMLDIEQTGIYAAVLSLAMILGLLTLAFNRAYVPWLFAGLKADAAGFRRRVVRGIFLYAMLAISAALTFGLAAPFLTNLILGEQFRSGVAVLPYLAIGFAFEGLYLMVANHILYSRRTSSLALATIVSGFTNIALCVFLIRRNGVVGAGQAFMLSHIVLFAITWWLAQRALPMPWWTSLSRAAS